ASRQSGAITSLFWRRQANTRSRSGMNWLQTWKALSVQACRCSGVSAKEKPAPATIKPMVSAPCLIMYPPLRSLLRLRPAGRSILIRHASLDECIAFGAGEFLAVGAHLARLHLLPRRERDRGSGQRPYEERRQEPDKSALQHEGESPFALNRA